MLPAGFHSRRRDRPNLRRRVDFVPRRGARFAGARRRQDDQLDGEPRGCRSVGRPNAPERVRNLSVRERAMVRRAVAVDLRERGHCAVHGIRRDVALSDAPAKCRAEPVPGFPRGGWLHVPYRPETRQHVARRDPVHRLVPDRRGVQPERRVPFPGERASRLSTIRRVAGSSLRRLRETSGRRRRAGPHPGRWPAAFSMALCRASANETSGNRPSPVVVSRPATRNRCLHVRDSRPLFIR